MESICLDSDTDSDWDHIDPDLPDTYNPNTASFAQPEDSRNRGYDSDDSDDDYAEIATGAPKRKKGGYDSRIEQILYENPDLPILIVDAGKSAESGGKYIVYTIRTGVSVRLVILSRLLTPM